MGGCLERYIPDHQPPNISVAKTIKKLYERVLRSIGINQLSDVNMKILMDRVGHVSVQYQDTMIIVWGGYTKSENHSNEYCDPSKVVFYHTLHGSATVVVTCGEIPACISGATASVHEENMYLIFGFIQEDSDGQNTESNINDIYVLNIPTLQWSKVTQRVLDGPMPLKADKLVSWVYKSQIFIFGGYGPPSTSGLDYAPNVTHIMDDSVPEMERGWNNQLVGLERCEQSEHRDNHFTLVRFVTLVQ
jgi:hypothetical protein